MSKYIFEISWEVANKVGGIHTVLASKANYLKNFYGKNYFVVGPYLSAKSQTEFRKLEIPKEFENIAANLKEKNINIYFGEWMINGLPNCFLIDFQKYLSEVNSLKYELWEKFGIDSLRTGKDYDEPIAWSKAVSEFIKEIINNGFQNSIFHCHEWLSGSVILFLKDFNLKTVFTTHATILGRTLASMGINFWEEQIDPIQTAYNLGIEAKHGIEKNAAKFTKVLTTVSYITANEVEKFLGRKVNHILPNGIDLNRFPTFEEIASRHQKNKSKILEFLLYFFSPYFKKHCPIKNSLIFFLSGRKEIKNKGFDLTILALGKLNQILKRKNIEKNIYLFIFVPDEIIDVDHDILENLITYQSLENYLENLQEEIKSRILHSLIHQKQIKDIFNQTEILEIKKFLARIKTHQNIPKATHILNPNNEFLSLLKKADLNNNENDKVKVIIYPIYLNSADGFLNLDYYEVINGSHLGIFPSFYEPWGYTPLETLAAGVMAITTDLTGFASYITEKNLLSKNHPGLFVLKRKGRKDDEVIDDLTEIFLEIALMSRSERIQNKYEARRLASYFDWQELIKNYLEVYERLLKE